jgi:hypothetical protein
MTMASDRVQYLPKGAQHDPDPQNLLPDATTLLHNARRAQAFVNRAKPGRVYARPGWEADPPGLSSPRRSVFPDYLKCHRVPLRPE